jgi:hypothetical protein
MQARADRLGGVGHKTACGNTVGVCGEQRGADALGIDPLDVYHTNPQRARMNAAEQAAGGGRVDICANCQYIFGKRAFPSDAILGPRPFEMRNLFQGEYWPPAIFGIGVISGGPTDGK